MTGPEDDHQLTLAAVGLWYRLRSAEQKGRITAHELMTLVGDPTAWHPDGAIEDLGTPLDELMANGWVVQQGDAYLSVGDD